MDKKLDSQIKEIVYTENTDVFFVDYFDTIVHRRCNPEAVKMLWANKLAKKYPNLNAEQFWLTRKEAENELKKNKLFSHEAPYSALVKEIYSRLLFVVQNLSYDVFFKECYSADVESECEVQYLDQDMLSFISQAKKNNKQVVVVSDFYLPRDAFNEFFVFHGIQDIIDDCYISCEEDARKSDGSLYDVVLQQKNCYNRCSMIGDNYISDYQIPHQKGILSVLRANPSVNHKLYQKLEIEKELFDIAKEKRKELFGRYAFILYYFVENLYSSLIDKGISNVFFLAREGLVLKRIFDWYLNKIGDKMIRSHYLCASRAATMLASKEICQYEEFEQFFCEYPNLTTRDFLYSLSFDNSEVSKICTQIGVEPDVLIHNFGKSNEFSNLCDSIYFQSVFAQKKKEQTNAFVAYLNTFNTDYENQGLCLVDVGWKGSIQDNIFNILGKEICIEGFYIGLTGKTISDPINRKTGIVFSRFPFKSSFCDIFEQQTFLLEQLLSANHGPTLGYVNTKNGAEPIFGEDENNDKIFLEVGKIQDNWFSTFDAIFDIFRFSCFKSSQLINVFAKIHLFTVLSRSKQERIHKKKWSRCASNNFGSGVISNNRNLRQKFLFFVKNLKHSDGNSVFKAINSIEQITAKLHCSWVDVIIEKVAASFISKKIR